MAYFVACTCMCMCACLPAGLLPCTDSEVLLNCFLSVGGGKVVSSSAVCVCVHACLPVVVVHRQWLVELLITVVCCLVLLLLLFVVGLLRVLEYYYIHIEAVALEYVRTCAPCSAATSIARRTNRWVGRAYVRAAACVGNGVRSHSGFRRVGDEEMAHAPGVHPRPTETRY